AIGFEILFPVGGSIPYIFQYSEIHHRRNAQGFSLFVCLALCIANILRILFWFGKRFDLALLAQSVVMFICMILMLEIAVRMNKKHTPKSQQKSLLSGLFLLEKSIIIAEIMDMQYLKMLTCQVEAEERQPAEKKGTRNDAKSLRDALMRSQHSSLMLHHAAVLPEMNP
ncbi:PQ loop repeat protein, partial [Ostertagia ostertagi]